MKKSAIIFLSFILPSALFAQVIDKPAATINLTQPQYISVNQLNARVDQVETIRRQNGLPIPPDDKQQVLDSMIAEILINQAAQKANITVAQSEITDLVNKQRQTVEQQTGPLNDDQYQALILQQTGVPWDQYLVQVKTQLVQQRYIMQLKGNVINSVSNPTDDQVKQRYDVLASRLTNPEIVRFSQVFIDTRNLAPADKTKAKQRADGIYRQYVNGQSTFDQIVMQNTDDQRSRYSGGDFGYLARDDVRAAQLLGQSFVDQIFTMKVGDVSAVMESRIGYHIVKLTEHYPPKLLTLDDKLAPGNPTSVREYIRNMLLQETKNQVYVQAVQDIVADLKKQADVQVFKQNLN